METLNMEQVGYFFAGYAIHLGIAGMEKNKMFEACSLYSPEFIYLFEIHLLLPTF